MKKLKKFEIKFYKTCFLDVMKMPKEDEFTQKLLWLYISYKSTDEDNFYLKIKDSFPKDTINKIFHNFKVIDKYILELKK